MVHARSRTVSKDEARACIRRPVQKTGDGAAAAHLYRHSLFHPAIQ